MRTIVLWCLVIALAGCVSSERIDLARRCRHEAGPKPYAAAPLFGLVGGLYALSQPETQAWNQKITDCMRDGTINASP